MLVLMITMLIITCKNAHTQNSSSVTTTITRTNVYLRLKAGLDKEYSAKSDEKIRLECEFEGQADTLYWIKNLEEMLEPKRGRIQIIKRNLSTILIIKRLDVFDKGSYSCFAENTLFKLNASSETVLNVIDADMNSRPRFNKKPQNDDFLSEFLNNDDEPPTLNPTIIESDDPHDTSQGKCEPYRGQICAQVFYTSNYSIYSLNDKQQFEIETKLRQIMPLIHTIPQSKAQCNQFILSSLCLIAFPLCDSSFGVPRPRQICRSDCVKLQYDVCLNEYIQIKSLFNAQDGLMLECNQLPPSSDIQTQCISPIQLTLDRLNPKKDPQTIDKSITQYKKLISLLYVLVPSICITFLVMCLFLTVCYCRKLNKTESSTTSSSQRTMSTQNLQLTNKLRMSSASVGLKQKQKCSSTKTNSSKSSVSNCSLPQQQQQIHQQQNSEFHPFLQPTKHEEYNMIRQLSAQSIRFLSEIGNGRFGRVFFGEIQLNQAKCVVKTLQSNEPYAEQEFFSEINLYGSLKHKNISNLIGVFTQLQDDFPRCMAMECLNNGDLHEYLIQRGQSLANQSLQCSQTNHSRAIIEFVYISQQIAQGMEYLSHHNFVHKDLASRNILMGESLLCKISDMAQYKEFYSKDYYKFQNRILPVRWMSPESLLFGRYAQDTDVYSFGVLLWEIFNYGVTPYSGCTNPEVVQMIRDRQLLMLPDECPPKIYQLMLECWHEHSVQRPTFTDLVNNLKNWENYYSLHHQVAQQQQQLQQPTTTSATTTTTAMVSSISNQTASTGFSSSSPIVHNTCCSPSKLTCQATSFKFKRPPSPPSSCITTTSSTRIYREIEATNSLRGSVRPSNLVPNI